MVPSGSFEAEALKVTGSEAVPEVGVAVSRAASTLGAVYVTVSLGRWATEAFSCAT